MNEYTCLAIIVLTVGCVISTNVRDVLSLIVTLTGDVLFGIGNAIREMFTAVWRM